MLNWIKNFFKKKPKPPCAKCKGTGEILRPAMRVGNMTEYDVLRCECMPKKKKQKTRWVTPPSLCLNFL